MYTHLAPLREEPTRAVFLEKAAKVGPKTRELFQRLIDENRELIGMTWEVKTPEEQLESLERSLQGGSLDEIQTCTKALFSPEVAPSDFVCSSEFQESAELTSQFALSCLGVLPDLPSPSELRKRAEKGTEVF